MQLVRVNVSIGCWDSATGMRVFSLLGEGGNVEFVTEAGDAQGEARITYERVHEWLGAAGLHETVDHVIDCARRAGLDVEDDFLGCSVTVEELIALADGRYRRGGEFVTPSAPA